MIPHLPGHLPRPHQAPAAWADSFRACPCLPHLPPPSTTGSPSSTVPGGGVAVAGGRYTHYLCLENDLTSLDHPPALLRDLNLFKAPASSRHTPYEVYRDKETNLTLSDDVGQPLAF